MKIDLTGPQLGVLKAAAQGQLSRTDKPDAPWRRLDNRHVVTRTAQHLADRGLIREAPPLDGRIRAVVTADGLELLAEIADRGPDPDGGD